MEDEFSQDDIDLATQLSLLDLEGKEEKYDEYEEELARAIKESLKSSSKHRSTGSSSSSYTSWVDCDVCNKVISPDMKYGKVEIWNQHFCLQHISDRTPICCGCRRFKQLGVEYLELADNRTICPDCHSISMNQTQEIGPLVRNVLQFFKHKGMEVKLQIPIFLVTRTEMTRLTSRGTSLGPLHPNSMIFGLTVNISTGGISIRSVTSSSIRGKQITIGEKEYQLSHRSRIAIMVLFGLPMLLTGAILAHEMMHAWLRLQGVGDLEPRVEEGICQVMGHEWLDWHESKHVEACHRSREEAQYGRNLKQTYKHYVELDSSRAYGDGFRDAKHSVAKHGLKYFIKYIIKYGILPT